MREVKRVLRRLFRQAPATFTLCAANVVVYLLTAVQSLSFLHNLDESSLAQHWVLYLPNMVDSIVGPLRAVGATFLHDGPAHLLFNIVMIYLLGREVEKKIGHALFSTVYFAGGVSGSALSVWLDPQHAVVGASGSAYALMAVFAGLAAKRRGSHYIDPGQPRFQRAQPGSLAGRARWWIDSGDCDGGGAHHLQNHAHALGWCAGRVWFGSGGVDDTRY